MYFSDDLKSFEAPEFHVDHSHFLPGDYKEYAGIVTTPESAYGRELLIQYADHCLKKGKEVFSASDQRACSGAVWILVV